MSKKLIGLLLALALVIGLLPVMALAEGGDLATAYTLKFGWNSYNLTKYDTPIYFVNQSYEQYGATSGDRTLHTYYKPATAGASEDNWNAKLIWHTDDEGPTLYLDGFRFDEYDEESAQWMWKGGDASASALNEITGITGAASAPLTIVLTGEDSVIETKLIGISFANDLTIKSEGNTKLSIVGMSAGIRSGAAGAGLTFEGNVDVHVQSYYTSSYWPIYVDGADLVVNSGNVKATIGTGNLKGLVIANSGNLIVNGGSLSVRGRYEGINLPEGGTATVNGGSLEYYGSYGGLYINKVKTKATAPEGACITILGEAWGDGSNATTQTTIPAYCYVKITYHTTLNEVIAKEASCKEDGNIQYWTCAKCGDYFADAAGATKITDKNSVVISKSTAAHAPEADDGDCTTAIKCSVCGEETTPAKAAHTAGTWTDGKTNCTVCNKEFSCTHTGGTATCEKKAVCTVCGEEYGELAAHTPGEDDGDCTTAVKCTVCGEDARPAGTHTGGTATCKAKAKCTNCGQEYGELAAHTPAEDDGDCSTAIKCTVCDAETTPAKAHTEEAIPGKPATKTETGLTEGKKCSTCGKILVAQKEIAKLPADGTNGNPATGDNGMAMWLGLMAVSAIAFVSIVIGKKKTA